MNALIFGANGQDGHYLMDLCRVQNIEVEGASRSGPFVPADISDYRQVEELIRSRAPSFVFHLAANSTTSHEALFENHQTISTGTVNVLESVKKHSPQTKVFITGSGVQFQNTGEPISETSPFEGNSPYSVSRIQSVYAARYYRSLGIKAYVGYLFHHESPLRKPHHVSQLIAGLTRRVKDGSDEKITLGDIRVEKEWTFAGDTMKAALALVRQDEVFEAVIGSGKTYSIEDWLEACFCVINKPWQDYVSLQEGFKPEYKKLVSDPSVIRSLGWSPEVEFRQLAEMMVNDTKTGHGKE